MLNSCRPLPHHDSSLLNTDKSLNPHHGHSALLCSHLSMCRVDDPLCRFDWSCAQQLHRDQHQAEENHDSCCQHTSEHTHTESTQGKHDQKFSSFYYNPFHWAGRNSMSALQKTDNVTTNSRLKTKKQNKRGEYDRACKMNTYIIYL